VNFNKSEVFGKLLEPLKAFQNENYYSRVCSILDDESWIKIGILRTLSDVDSGRAFLEKLVIEGDDYIPCSHFYGALKSNRRLDYCQELNNLLTESIKGIPSEKDPFYIFPELELFHLFAGDGHYHKAPVHEIKVGEKVYATQHFYSLNLRNHMMKPLTLAEYGEDRKKEHDMRALKRMTISDLRQGAKKGEKVLYVWDKAGIDFAQWHKWKMQGGIYFLSLEKESNNFQDIEDLIYDKEDSVNYGVAKDEMVSTSQGIRIRRVTYICPDTGEIYKFLTNLPKSIRPGVIAFLYKTRWDIEKKYNTFKHKLYERRAWAVTENAKIMQAVFICLTHNLTLLFNEEVEKEVAVTKKDLDKQKSRMKKLEKKAKNYGRKVAPHILEVKRVTELPKKFFNWLRSWVFRDAPWQQAIEKVRILFENPNLVKRTN